MHLDVCSRCNAKVGANNLSKILEELPLFRQEDILVGFEGNENGAVIQIIDYFAVVTSLDFLPPVAEDTYTFGKIAAANTLSDLYPMEWSWRTP